MGVVRERREEQMREVEERTVVEAQQLLVRVESEDKSDVTKAAEVEVHDGLALSAPLLSEVEKENHHVTDACSCQRWGLSPECCDDGRQQSCLRGISPSSLNSS